MKRNVGVLDKGIRLFLATLCAIYGFTHEPRSGLNGLLILTAAYLFITSLAGVCALYSALGWSSREKKRE